MPRFLNPFSEPKGFGFKTRGAAGYVSSTIYFLNVLEG
jgi:hypothetical protein